MLSSWTIAVAQTTVAWTSPNGGVMLAVASTDNVYTVRRSSFLGGEMSLVQTDPQGNQVWVASHDQTGPTKWEFASWGGHSRIGPRAHDSGGSCPART